MEDTGCSAKPSFCGTIYLEMDGLTRDEDRYIVSDPPGPGPDLRTMILTYRGFCDEIVRSNVLRVYRIWVRVKAPCLFEQWD